MSTGSEKVSVVCPACDKRLLVPGSTLGKQGRCPACQTIFTLEQLFEADPVMSPSTAEMGFAPAGDSWNSQASSSFASKDDYQLQQAQQSEYATANYAYAPPQVSESTPYQAAPQPAKGEFWDNSLLGGIALMVIAVVWFFGGLFFDIIFFYAPVLFIVGAFVAVKGLVSGKIMG